MSLQQLQAEAQQQHMGSVRLLQGLGEVTEVRVRGGVETYLNLETGPALEFSNVDIDIHNYI